MAAGSCNFGRARLFYETTLFANCMAGVANLTKRFATPAKGFANQPIQPATRFAPPEMSRPMPSTVPQADRLVSIRVRAIRIKDFIIICSAFGFLVLTCWAVVGPDPARP